MGLFDLFKKPSAKPKDRTLTTETFTVVGVNYCDANVKKLACRNSEWKFTAKQIIDSGKLNKKIFRYNFISKPVKLEPEPDNKHDKNAIQVIVAGEKVGYISRSDNGHVKDVLRKREIKYISCFIGGGQYKYVNEDGEMFHDEDDISVKIKIAYV